MAAAAGGLWSNALARIGSILPPTKAPAGALIASACLAGCSAGPMHIEETRYFAVPDGESTNYYRMQISGQTALGVASYRSGWYPARAVDGVFGAVSSEGGISAIETRAAIEREVSEKIKSTTKAWLDAAADPKTKRADLVRLMEARRLVLAYPSPVKPPYKNAFEIQFNPAIGVALTHADEKLIFILSSNPDEVIGKIKNFSESEQTVLTINQLSQVVAKRARNEVDAQVAVETVDRKADSLVVARLRSANTVAADENTTRERALLEIETLVHLIDAVQR